MPDAPSSVAAALKQIQKKNGADIAGKGLHLPTRPRIPIGVLAFDIASGGGFPTNRMSLIYGAESSGKTLMATCAIREFQKRWPKYQCVLVEPEGDYDTDWARRCGVNVDDLYMSRPDWAEMASDHVGSFLQAPDCGLVVLDSIAAMSSLAEMDKDADQPTVGGASQIINRMIRKSRVYLSQAERAGRPTTFLILNQPRMKAGVVFGNPETLPGGNQQRFQTGIRVRLRGKQKVVPAIAKDAPALLDVNGTIEKNKQSIVTRKFEYTIMLVGTDELQAGRSNDFKAFKQYASEMGLMEAVKGGTQLVDPSTGEAQIFKTQTAMWDSVRDDPAKLDMYLNAILEEQMPWAFQTT